MAAVATSRGFASDPSWRQAQTFLDRPLFAECEESRLLMQAAVLRQRLERHAEALKLLDRGHALGHANAALRFHRSESLPFNGRIEETETESAASLVDMPARGRMAVQLVRLRRQMPERNRLAALAEHFYDYRRVMLHRRSIMPGSILDVSHADLVHEPETTVHKVSAFCRLGWEPGCTDPRLNTAPSATQECGASTFVCA